MSVEIKSSGVCIFNENSCRLAKIYVDLKSEEIRRATVVRHYAWGRVKARVECFSIAAPKLKQQTINSNLIKFYLPGYFVGLNSEYW